MAGERGMSAQLSLQARVEQYLAERRRGGFELSKMGHALVSFARHIQAAGHRGPLTVDVMAAWARQAKSGRGDRATSARRLKILRPFARWLQQFDPTTEVPDEAIFGAVPGRMTPHIYREPEIVELLAAARQIGPEGGLRPVVMETLFGLIACTGLRIAEALGLVDADVDLLGGELTIRHSKFGRSRLVPLHPSAVQALGCYRTQRARHVRSSPESPFFVSSRGRLLGQPVGDRQVHRIFDDLRRQLGWVDRGSHGTTRIHDLRHSFAVRRLVLWHEQGVDMSQQMLALSTYLGHVKVSNTYWYLTGVPELMGLIGQRFERFAHPWEDRDE
jgi:integrase